MKGIVFTEFLDLVEQKFGFDMVDNIIDDCELASGASYTSVGTYDHSEIVDLVTALSKRTDTPVPTLLKVYGEHLFGRFTIHYPRFFEDESLSAFDFLEGIESYIHVEVQKLYPNAELPRFDVERPDEHTLKMIYHSSRHFEDLAEGLINGCLSHFGESCEMTRVDHNPSGGVHFTLATKSGADA